MLRRLINAIKSIFSPKVKPLSTTEILKKIQKPKKVSEAKQKLLNQLKELEAEREAYQYEQESVQERIKIIDDKFLKGEINSKERLKEFRRLLKTAVKLRKKLDSLDVVIRKTKAQLQI